MIDPAALDIARLALDFAERHNHSGVVVQTGTLRSLIEECEPPAPSQIRELEHELLIRHRRPGDWSYFPIPAHAKKDTP